MKRAAWLWVCALLGCRSPSAAGPHDHDQSHGDGHGHDEDQQATPAVIDLPPEQRIERTWPAVSGAACATPTTQPEPVSRKPKGRRARALAYPPTYGPTKPASVELADAALGRDLVVTMVQLERWGGFVSELATTSPEFGGGHSCLSNPAVVERWADLLADHAPLFGIDQPFAVEGQGNSLVVQHPEFGAPIMIVKHGGDGPVRLIGHWWPGLVVPQDMLTAQDIRDRASDYRLMTAEWVPQPVECAPGSPCNQQTLEQRVDAGPLSAQDITELVTGWIGTGAGQRLEFRLVTQIITGRGSEIAIDGVSGALYREVERPALMWFNVGFRDSGRSRLGL